MAFEQFDADEVARFENATWSRCAETYVDGFGALVGEAISPLLDEVKVGSGDRVLDVGTGPGLVAAAAAERGASAVGTDFSEAMLATARRLHPHIEFQRAPAESLPFDDGSFDAVVGNFVLHHSGAPDEVLHHACRVLRPGGRAAFTVWADLSKLEAFGLFFAAVEEHAGSAQLPHGPLFGVTDFNVFHQMLGHAGFRDSSVRELPIAWRTPSLDSFLASFHDWADLGAFPEQLRTKIEAAVRERAASYWSGDAFVLPNPAILISAVK
ncbi:MAG TPA: class I SAM-dependent methyltransferase [Acidobacteriota bacterium]|nr:class I SAM-dependent methyltransferase [Acidobacteriota bacterium]